MKFNLILSLILIILSILGVIFKPFNYWWVASILTGLIAIVLLWFFIKPQGQQ